jgi:starch synthase
MRIALLSREFPPEIYGGGGSHVGNLVPRLRRTVDVDVHTFGEPKAADPPHVHRHRWSATMDDTSMALRALELDARIAACCGDAQVLHSQTWYTNMAGHYGKIMYDVPHVITSHSLELRRPWKTEQPGSAYGMSLWIEDTAYRTADAVIAVSEWMREDVLECMPFLDPDRVFAIHNGIDTEVFHPTVERDALATYGIDPDRPIVLYVGRISPQKGILPLLAAAHRFTPSAQLVVCAGRADATELAAATERLAALRATRDGVFWIPDLYDIAVLRQLFTAATVFVSPSIYEPMGIVNLEAMACATAVVASEVGGIPEVVAAGETGMLVPYRPDSPEEHAAGLADAVNSVVADPAWAAELGRAGRKRAEEVFSWDEVALRTLDVYRRVQEGTHA